MASKKEEESGPTKSFDDTWELLEDLGTGTYATVKRARNKKTGEEAAVKIMVKSKVDDMAALRREVDVLKKVGGVPHVVHLRDWYETQRHMFFVMELCQGGELFDKLIKVGVFSEQTVAHQMKQILEALAACHRSNIVHRDLKPENLLLASAADDAELKVCDFGVSKVLKQPNDHLSDVAGSPLYIAPEMASTDAVTALSRAGALSWGPVTDGPRS